MAQRDTAVSRRTSFLFFRLIVAMSVTLGFMVVVSWVLGTFTEGGMLSLLGAASDDAGSGRLGTAMLITSIALAGSFAYLGFAWLRAWERRASSGVPHAAEQPEADRSLAASTAAPGGDLAVKEHSLHVKRHRLEIMRHETDTVRDLRSRYTACAAQLGDGSPAVRHAGVYALASLADDWMRLGNQTEVQVCVDVLCSYLRIPYSHAGKHSAAAAKAIEGEREVRWTIIKIIRQHLLDPDNPLSWCGLQFDFTGAVFDGGGLHDAHFTGGEVSFADAEFAGATFSFARATFSGGTVNFTGTRFGSGDVDFYNAQFTGATVYFYDAHFDGANVLFLDSAFTAGALYFYGANFVAGGVNFTGARFAGATLNFDHPQAWTAPPIVPWKPNHVLPAGVQPVNWPPAPAPELVRVP